jgi:hypothetical protein
MTPRRRRRLLRLLFVLVLAVSLYLARHPLLRGLAGFLVVEDPVREADAALLLSGDRLPERAADLYRDGTVKRLLLVRGAPGRLQRIGAVPDVTEAYRAALERCEVPATAVDVLETEKRGDWNSARRLRDWLREHPDAQVIVLCARFGSRRTRCLFEQELGGLAGRVRWLALADRRYDEADWYRHRAGAVDLFDSYLGWGHVKVYGDALGDRDEWDPDAYRNSLR